MKFKEWEDILKYVLVHVGNINKAGCYLMIMMMMTMMMMINDAVADGYYDNHNSTIITMMNDDDEANSINYQVNTTVTYKYSAQNV